MEKWINRERRFTGNIIAVDSGAVQLEDGLVAQREIVLHGGGVAVVPLLGESVILVRQFRIAVGKPMLELPAGRLEPGETPEHRARAELEEEVGYRAGELIHAASCYCSPGFTNEMDHIYLAFDLEESEQNLDHDERVDPVHVPMHEVERMLEAREIDDMKTVLGLRELQAFLAKRCDA